MRSKLISVIVLLGGILLMGVLMGGCGETEHSSSAYYYPNWMPDGRIVCWKVVSRWSEALFGRRELGTTAYITAMDVEGNNETNIFEDSGWGGEITCSPTGEMIGYIAYPDKLTIINSDGTNKRVVANTASGVEFFDWSPDGTKIAYMASNKLYVINVDGTENMLISAESYKVAWRNGSKIAHNTVSIINPDGSNADFVVIGGDPQITVDGKIMFMAGTTSLGVKEIREINYDGTNDVLLVPKYERTTMKLSFDNAKIVGGDLITGGGSDIGGIWVTNISDGKATKIR